MVSEQDITGGSFSIKDILDPDHMASDPGVLAEELGEHGLRNYIAELSDESIGIDAEIAKLESTRRRLRAELLSAQNALRIASDKGLE